MFLHTDLMPINCIQNLMLNWIVSKVIPHVCNSTKVILKHAFISSQDWDLNWIKVQINVFWKCRTTIKNRSHRIASYVFKREREMFYLTMHSTHFIYGYMASDIWLRTILIVRKETRCHHIGYFYRLTARVLLYAPSNREDNTYHGICYTSHGALAGTRNSSMGMSLRRQYKCYFAFKTKLSW